MSTLQTATLCEQRARDLCHTLGDSGTTVLLVLGLAAAWAKQWWATRQLAQAKLVEVTRLKQERNEHAAKAQQLEVKVASLSPPPPSTPPALYVATERLFAPAGVPSASSVGLTPIDFKTIPPSEPPRDLAGEPVDPELEHADTLPPRGRK